MKLKIDIDDETGVLLQYLAITCKLTVSELIDRLTSGHLCELWELHTFLQTHSADAEKTAQASNLLISYGQGEGILQGIKRIAPEYVTLEAQFVRDLDAPFHQAEAGR